MNMKLKKVLDEIQKTEERITEWQEHLRELNIRKSSWRMRRLLKYPFHEIKQPGTSGSIGQNPEWNGCFSVSDGRNYCAGYKKEEDWKDIAEERKLPGHRAEEKEDEHRENEN